MQCRTCNAQSGHIITRQGIDSCHMCGGFTESGGKTEGLITRNTLRIRQEAVMYEGATIHPYEYDKTRKKTVPSREFIKLYPDQAHEYFTDSQLIDAGHVNLPHHLKKRQKKIEKQVAKELSSVQSVGSVTDAAKRQKEILS